MSPPSVTTSSSSKLNQFGLYRSIDERTEEFLKLSRKRQVRQGCVCAAISTAITVAIVVSILLLYEYQIVGYRVLRRRTGTNYTEELNNRLSGKETNKLAILPSLLRVLSKDNNQDTSYESTKQSEPITEYQFKKDWVVDLTSKIKPSLRGIEQKTSPIIFLKAPLGMLDFYSKAREAKKTKNHNNAIGYIDRLVPLLEYQPKQNYMNVSKERTNTSKSLFKVRQVIKVKPLSVETTTTYTHQAIQHSKRCCCNKSLQELIKRLIESIQQLMISKVLCSKTRSIEVAHKSCCHKKATEKNILVTTQDPSDYLESDQLNIASTPTREAEPAKMLEIKYNEYNFKNFAENNIQTVRINDTNHLEAENYSTGAKITTELFKEYFEYIAKQHSSTTTEVMKARHPDTTSRRVASFDVPLEIVDINFETTATPEDKKYVHISKINNPRLKTTTAPMSTTIKSLLFTEAIKPPNQSEENYNQFLKVLQEYKDLNDHAKTLFDKSITVDALEFPRKVHNNNNSFIELSQNNNNITLNSENSSIEISSVPVVLSTPKDSMVEIFKSDYIKVVNGMQKLHSSAKKHNSQYLAILSEGTNINDITKKYTTAIPDSVKTTPVQVFKIHHNYKEMQKVPFGIYKPKDLELKTEKPDTIEELEIDDQMRINDNIDSNEEKDIKKKLDHRFGEIPEYNIPYSVSKLISGRPSYLEISNRNDWSPHFDDEAYDTA